VEPPIVAYVTCVLDASKAFVETGVADFSGTPLSSPEQLNGVAQHVSKYLSEDPERPELAAARLQANIAFMGLMLLAFPSVLMQLRLSSTVVEHSSNI
jgi:hypothetical protein